MCRAVSCGRVHMHEMVRQGQEEAQHGQPFREGHAAPRGVHSMHSTAGRPPPALLLQKQAMLPVSPCRWLQAQATAAAPPPASVGCLAGRTGGGSAAG